MNLSKFFIDRPIFAGVLSVLIFLAGLLALRVMPISEYPEVAPCMCWAGPKNGSGRLWAIMIRSRTSTAYMGLSC